MIRRCPGILLFFLLTGHLAATAQQDQSPKVDTTVADTIVVGEEGPLATSALKTHIDTTFSAAPELGTATPSPDESPVLRHLPDTTVYRWQHNPKYAYANDPDYWKIRREKPGSFQLWLARLLTSDGFKYTILGLVGALLLYAIIRIAMENNLTLFYRKTKKTKGSIEEEEGLPQPEDIDERLRYYLGIGDKRQVTRYLYLKSLHLLSARNFVRLHAETTNQQYLRQLHGTHLEPAFRVLTGAYERVWYGDFILSEASFQRLHEYFTEFFKTLQA